MNSPSDLSNPQSRWPLAITLGSAVLVMWYLFFRFGYSTGYMFERSTLWSNVRQGYRMDDAEWAFGYFVPPAVVLMLWLTRNRFAGISPKPSWLGVAILALACFIYFGGYKANEKFVGYASGQLFVAGFILWFLGIEYFRRAFWLWVFFGLTWPLTFLIEPISTPLQLLMTVLTEAYFKLVGVDVIRSGTSLMSPPVGDIPAGEKFSLGIAAKCSGLRSLFALGMVSLLFGYISLSKGWHRLVLALASVPFAIFGNFVRMLLLYYGTIFVSKEFAIGESEHDPSPYHMGAGIMVFIVALGCMLVLVQVLNGGFRSLRRKRVRARVIHSGALAQNGEDPPA